MKKTFGLLAWLVVGLALPGLTRADLQPSLDKALRTMDHALGPSFQKIAVGGIVDEESGNRSPACQKLEDGLRLGIARSTNRAALSADQDPEGADALLSGTIQRQDGQVDLHLVLTDQKSTLLWKGDCGLAASDFSPGDFQPEQAIPKAPAGGGEGGQVIPKMPQGEGGSYYGYAPVYATYGGPTWWPANGLTMDVSIGYKSFFPINTDFQSAVGGQISGLTLGLSFNDILLLDFDAYNQDVTHAGNLQSVAYTGSDISLVYPFHLGRHFVAYLGPGGRFGELEADDGIAPPGSIVYGNNGFMAVAGVKAKAEWVGLDLRYTYDMSYSYTGYHTLTLGAFYEFGR